jgi:ABC-type lipoprotein release transport system permease subunit
MMIPKIAFRNIFRQKRRSILTALTMFGGFALATVSIGWADGSYNFIINMFTQNRLGHIQIHANDYRERPSIYKTLNDYQKIGVELQEFDRIIAWTPRLFSAGLVAINEKSTGAQIIGLDPVREESATSLQKKIIKGKKFSSIPAHEAIIGKGLAKMLNANIDDEIVIVSQGADGSIANDIYHIVGIMDSGDDISDRLSCYLHIEDAQELFVLYGRIHEIAIVVDRLDGLKQLAMTIQEKLENPDYEVAPWQIFAKSFYQAMKADKEGMWIMLFVIMLIVAVGVLNTVLMSVLERRREYGILKAMGTRPQQIFWLVITEVNILAIFSIIIGAILGTLFNYLLSFHGITLPQSFTYGGMEFKTMYTEVNARSIYIPLITVLFSAFVVSIFPALKAAKTEPARSMRIH